MNNSTVGILVGIRIKVMKKLRLFLISLTILLNFCISSANAKPVRFSDIRLDLESAIGKLSMYINIFEGIQNKMDASAKANQNYNEQKNIFLSSQLAIITITAILEYNRDLLILFGDLREKNRKKFYEVRIESLQTSINQISNMRKQIQINYTILPPDFFEQTLVDTEQELIVSSMVSLEACTELLKSVNQK
jgi:hypothetical protein